MLLQCAIRQDGSEIVGNVRRETVEKFWDVDLPREVEETDAGFDVEIVEYEVDSGVDDFSDGEVVCSDQHFGHIVVVQCEGVGVDVREDQVDCFSSDTVVNLWNKNEVIRNEWW